VAPDEIERLQLNVVRSHACGVGEPLPRGVVRAMMLIRANVLAKGYSGIRPVVARRLCALLNKGVTPVVPSRGSVGASGDLAPLAHMALVLIGEGEAEFEGRRMGRDALAARVERSTAFERHLAGERNSGDAWLRRLALLDARSSRIADAACASLGHCEDAAGV
jgi:histidine ammonia-lyase